VSSINLNQHGDTSDRKKGEIQVIQEIQEKEIQQIQKLEIKEIQERGNTINSSKRK
jgi:hypothetical protein